MKASASARDVSHIAAAPAGPAMAARGGITPVNSFRLLACLDDGDIGDAVLRHALALARGFGLGIDAAHVIETVPHAASPADPVAWQLCRRQNLDRLSRRISANGFGESHVDPVLLSGAPADALTRWAAGHASSVLVLGTRGPVGGQGLGTTAHRIIEHSGSSVLLVPPASTARFDGRYRRILLPLDGSCRAESVLPVAMRIAHEHGAELLLVHAVPVTGLAMALPGASDPDCARIADRNERDARDYLDAVQAKLWKARLPARTLVVARGDARPVLRQLACEQHADLIILSSHGRNGMADVPYGSVAEYLATHAPVPVLMVRPSLAEALGARRPGEARFAAISVPMPA